MDEAEVEVGDREGTKPHVWAIFALKTHLIQPSITRYIHRAVLLYSYTTVGLTLVRSFLLAQPTMCIDPWLNLERT